MGLLRNTSFVEGEGIIDDESVYMVISDLSMKFNNQDQNVVLEAVVNLNLYSNYTAFTEGEEPFSSATTTLEILQGEYLEWRFPNIWQQLYDVVLADDRLEDFVQDGSY